MSTTGITRRAYLAGLGASECGFGHVPLDITRAKLSALVRVCGELSQLAGRQAG